MGVSRGKGLVDQGAPKVAHVSVRLNLKDAVLQLPLGDLLVYMVLLTGPFFPSHHLHGVTALALQKDTASLLHGGYSLTPAQGHSVLRGPAGQGGVCVLLMPPHGENTGLLPLQVASMNQRRVDFYLASIGDVLVAVGGRNENGALSSVETYSPKTDSWAYVAGLPR